MIEHIYHDYYFGRANKFNFWNVGQGLFYTGSLFGGEFNFVYDCGGSPGIIDKRVEEHANTLNSKKTIDVIFISHFHNDHINGLVQIMQSVYHVKKVIVPYFPDTDYILVNLLSQASSAENFEYIATQWKNIRLVFYGFERNETLEKISLETNSDWGNSYGVDSNGLSYFSPQRSFDWKFVLSNSQDRNYADMVNCVIKHNLQGKTIEEYFDFSKKPKSIKKQLNQLLHINKTLRNQLIKDGFSVPKKIDLTQNGSSLCVLHYPSSKDSLFEVEQSDCVLETNNGCCLDIKPVKCHAPATLLTGDGAVLQESNTQLEKYSDNDEISTKVMQIPHHGAKEEWSKTVENLLSNRKYCFENYVVSYGFGNNYGHPTYELIDDLAQHNIEERLYSATQFTTFEYTILNR